MKKKRFKVIDLFCGIGGFSYGFEMTRSFDVVCGVDIWDIALDTFKLNHRGSKAEVINGDISKIKKEFWEKYKNKIGVI